MVIGLEGLGVQAGFRGFCWLTDLAQGFRV